MDPENQFNLTHSQFVHSNKPLHECYCIFSVCGAVFNSLECKVFVNIGYSQDRLALLQDISRIGLKITRDGALEFFCEWPEPRCSSRRSL